MAAPDKPAKPGDDKKLDLTVVINGNPHNISIPANASLQSLIARALEDSGNTGQPSTNWVLTKKDGTLLDAQNKPSDYGLADGDTLFLNLKAGVGG